MALSNPEDETDSDGRSDGELITAADRSDEQEDSMALGRKVILPDGGEPVAETDEKTPDELAKGDLLEVEYDPANGEENQTLSGTVDDVDRLTDGETVHFVKATVAPDEKVRIERDEYFAREGEASRRVEFYRHSEDRWKGSEVEGKNGARWHRISRVSGVESWTITDGDDAETQSESETDV